MCSTLMLLVILSLNLLVASLASVTNSTSTKPHPLSGVEKGFKASLSSPNRNATLGLSLGSYDCDCPDNSVCVDNVCYCRVGYEHNQDYHGYDSCDKLYCRDTNECDQSFYNTVCQSSSCVCDYGSPNQYQECPDAYDSDDDSGGYFSGSISWTWAVGIIGVIAVIGIIVGCFCCFASTSRQRSAPRAMSTAPLVQQQALTGMPGYYPYGGAYPAAPQPYYGAPAQYPGYYPGSQQVPQVYG